MYLFILICTYVENMDGWFCACMKLTSTKLKQTKTQQQPQSNSHNHIGITTLKKNKIQKTTTKQTNIGCVA